MTTDQAPQDLAQRLVEFVDALRGKGIPAGTSETVDAAAVMAALGFEDRRRLREGLASALVRRGGQRDVFDMTFDLYFPAGVGLGASATEIDAESVEDLRDLLLMAIAEGDTRMMQQLAELAVETLGNVATAGSSAGGWSAYQTLDRLNPRTLTAAAEAMRSEQRGNGQGAGQGGGQGGGSGTGGSSAGLMGGDVADSLTRDEVRRMIDLFRTMVEAEARRRTAEVRGRELVTQHAVRKTSGQIDFLSANAQQLEELRQAVQPLARKLATRLSARRRRSRRGRIDIRRTMRRAMGTGGVPMRPVHAPPHRTRPELVLLCDVSGSVAGFSGFTMLLVQALREQFSKVRVFAFVNTVDEVTDIVREGGEVRRRISEEARITKWHTSSDYGESFLDFVADHLDAVGPRTSVLVLGDARNNNQALRLEALHEIAQRSKRCFWLNPEHSGSWGLGDSVAPEYAEVVEMHECRTISQLERFISRLLPV
ncbi:VWA domain-containing protein [Aeromicrobium sp. Leaf350]|uniref:VWA domain-containing protein n=1 Tax=Aeromicrobium sp. Leaf350 TaxID=2876565 RepID=UPI001E3843B1|nr:VWA domain-containing protein [Aeromicrobium sp. Leaf350]